MGISSLSRCTSLSKPTIEMTPATGKRISRACLRCRRRKTKCNLDGIGEPKKPPCESCHRSNSECLLVHSRRGLGGRKRKTPPITINPATDAEHPLESCSSIANADDPPSTVPGLGPPTPSDYCPGSNGESNRSGSNDDDVDDLHMELRNPSDALQILSQVRDSPQGARSSEQQWSTPDARLSETGTPQTRSALGSIGSTNFGNHAAASRNAEPSTTLLDDYELVQRGLLHPAVVPELINIFARRYHAYCPIVPVYMLEPQSMSKIQRRDYFLLTVILAIASRDSPRHVLTHRYCWDHTERQLLEVLLAHRWVQTPRTVQGLLLLAEWLPYQSKHERSASSMSLLGDDQSAWSIIGLAVRQAYLLRLDRGAFRKADDCDSSDDEQEEEKRLIWTFVYLADRQISVRMGQSFWSRGPSLSSTLTAEDFPNLKPLAGSDDGDLALVLQAHHELTQILYNAHGILYSSAGRTLAMVNDGDYARYLDDFQRSTSTWLASWRDIQASQNIKTTLMLLFEYVCLYVNTFSFQAVLTRATGKQSRGFEKRLTGGRVRPQLFSQGLMASPDGPYIYEAVSSAQKILVLFKKQNPQDMLRYLPTRYHLYGVYAAVFLYKAQRAGVFQSPDQEQENYLAAKDFIIKLEQTTADELSLCRRYSDMLSRIWQRQCTPHHLTGCDRTRDLESTVSAQDPTLIPRDAITISSVECVEPQTGWYNNQYHDPNTLPAGQYQTHPEWSNGAEGQKPHPVMIQQGNDGVLPPDIEDYFFRSFFPGVMDVDIGADFGDGLPLN